MATQIKENQTKPQNQTCLSPVSFEKSPSTTQNTLNTTQTILLFFFPPFFFPQTPLPLHPPHPDVLRGTEFHLHLLGLQGGSGDAHRFLGSRFGTKKEPQRMTTKNRVV